MLFGRSGVTEVVLKYLAENPSSTVKKMSQEIRLEGRSVTKQAVYRVLNKLSESDVVVHENGRFSLKLSWIVRMSNFVHSVEKKYYQNEQCIQAFPGKGETQEWIFPSLHTMDPFGCHIDLSLIRSSGAESLYAWEPHSWYTLLDPLQEIHFSDAVEILGKKRKIVVGGSSKLDLHCCRASSPTVYEQVHVSDFRNSRNYYEYIYAPYILEVNLPQETADEIDEFYVRNVNIESLDLSALLRISRREIGDVSLKISNDEDRAAALEETYRSHF